MSSAAKRERARLGAKRWTCPVCRHPYPRRLVAHHIQKHARARSGR